MSKRFLSLFLTLTLLLTALAAFADGPEADSNTYYIYTMNGKPLNARSAPGGTVVSHLPCGQEVTVQAFVDSNWALVSYISNEAEDQVYVNRRFLTRRDPATWHEDLSEEGYLAADAHEDPLTAINNEFHSAKKVDPYKVLVRPTRVSGWADLRWAPSQSAEVEAVYRANTELLVLKELDNWLQVQDPNTGDIGFINRGFVAQ